MPNGTIVRLLTDKGFGFISDEGGVEHFPFGKANGSSSPSNRRQKALAPLTSA